MKEGTHVTTGTPTSHRHSLRDGFNGFLRDLPGVHDVLVTVIGAMQSIVANLTPAKGRQDHTTSPSATVAARLATPSRPSHPTQRFVTIGRNAPLCRGGMT
jgi:hypothetical protein